MLNIPQTFVVSKKEFQRSCCFKTERAYSQIKLKLGIIKLSYVHYTLLQPYGVTDPANWYELLETSSYVTTAYIIVNTD